MKKSKSKSKASSGLGNKKALAKTTTKNDERSDEETMKEEQGSLENQKETRKENDIFTTTEATTMEEEITKPNNAIFESYRVLGIVCDSQCPSVVKRFGNAKSFAYVAVGCCFIVYELEKLHVSIISRNLASNIKTMAVNDPDNVFVGAGNSIFKFQRAVSVKEYCLKSPVLFLLNFGAEYLVSLTKSGEIITWDAKSGEELQTISLGSDFNPTALLHPHTYLNKILVGNKQGALQLWNIHTGKLIYTFRQNEETGFSGISCLVQSPTVDVIAVGRFDGSISILNLRFDKVVLSFQHFQAGGVTSMCFTERDELISSTNRGEILCWNLNEERLNYKIRTASKKHPTSVVFLSVIPGWPDRVFVQYSNNQISILQLQSNEAKLVLKREGHEATPTKIRFHPMGSTVATLSSGSDAKACQILSAGGNELRVFHTALDHQAKKLSTSRNKVSYGTSAAVDEGLGEFNAIKAFASMESRTEKDFCNVVTVHNNDFVARAWHFERGCLIGNLIPNNKNGFNGKKTSKRRFNANDEDVKANMESVTLSNCGNYALVGTGTGLVFKYNVQSGAPRETYPKQVFDQFEKTKQRKTQGKPSLLPAGSVLISTGVTRVVDRSASVARDVHTRHEGKVTGICLDGLDVCLFTSSLDGTIRVWDFETHALLDIVDVHSPIALMESSKDGGFFAFACDDFSVGVFDKASRKVVRRFKNAHTSQVTDLTFSPDGRWVLSASLDSTVKVFDIPTGKLIDWMFFESPVKTLSFSSTNEFLATCHYDSPGIYLWANSLHFLGSAQGALNLKSNVDAPVKMRMPFIIRETDQDDDEEEEIFQNKNNPKKNNHPEEVKVDFKQNAQKACENTIQLSSTKQASRWFSLSHLEIIKERNKPIQPPDKPKSAPFFIPVSVNELEKPQQKMESKIISTLSSTTTIDNNKSNKNNKVQIGLSLSAELEEVMAEISVNRAKENELLNAFNVRLNETSPSGIDFELNSIVFDKDDDFGAKVLLCWLNWVKLEMWLQRDYEIVQAILGRLLTLHGEIINAREELRFELGDILKKHESNWNRLNSQMQKTLCLVEHYAMII